MRHAETVTFGGSGLDRAAELRPQDEVLQAQVLRMLAHWKSEALIDKADLLDLTAAAEAQTEPVEVTGPRLSVNAICLFGRLQIRVIDDVSVPEGYDFADCNALERRDVTDCPITWGDGHKDLSPFVGKKIRLHIQADNATSLFSYRFGQVVS